MNIIEKNNVRKLNRNEAPSVGQMELFGYNNKLHEVIKNIENLDISTMTPIDALVFLNNIHDFLHKTNKESIKIP
ncbi:MAG: hypothetical protein HQK67_10645 [Desulfamplus sp.]|nr:hypothetical protein [Desulfamplus sp.]